MKLCPPDAHPLSAWLMLRDKYDLGDVFVLDMWPVVEPFLIITDPLVAASVTQTNSLPKHPVLKEFLGSLTGETSIVTNEGQQWRMLRNLFNPGFQPAFLLSLVPSITDHMSIFRDKLFSAAKTGEIVRMQELATLCTIDIIGQVVLGEDFKSQLSCSPFVYHYRAALASTSNSVDIVRRLRNAIPMWWHCRQADKYIGDAIRRRYKSQSYATGKTRVAIDMALQAYNESMIGNKKGGSGTELDKEFFGIALDK